MASQSQDYNTEGWVRNDSEVGKVLGELKYPVFRYAGTAIRGSGRGKTIKTWKIVKQVAGRHIERNQGSVGSCVAFGLAGAADALRCIQIVQKKTGEEFRAPLSPEYFYGASRVEIGQGQLAGSDGSLGAWAIRAYQEYGSLLQQRYGSVDLRKYDERRCRTWGENGVPDELEQTGREHPLITASQVGSFDECMDIYANGGVCTFASDLGLTNKRDAEGFLHKSGRWAHQMYGIGAKDDRRPGILFDNSWSFKWVSGPRPDDIPPGSGWVDAKHVDWACLSGDCWGIVSARGWRPQLLDLSDWGEA
ncbi:MAG: hypothetical protein AB8G99_24685 [Planctomycetaceae bacterium]